MDHASFQAFYWNEGAWHFMEKSLIENWLSLPSRCCLPFHSMFSGFNLLDANHMSMFVFSFFTKFLCSCISVGSIPSNRFSLTYCSHHRASIKRKKRKGSFTNEVLFPCIIFVKPVKL
jgi:hypothetical protein